MGGGSIVDGALARSIKIICTVIERDRWGYGAITDIHRVGAVRGSQWCWQVLSGGTAIVASMVGACWDGWGDLHQLEIILAAVMIRLNWGAVSASARALTVTVADMDRVRRRADAEAGSESAILMAERVRRRGGPGLPASPTRMPAKWWAGLGAGEGNGGNVAH